MLLLEDPLAPFVAGILVSSMQDQGGIKDHGTTEAEELVSGQIIFPVVAFAEAEQPYCLALLRRMGCRAIWNKLSNGKADKMH
eukprot:gene10873-19696_t